MKRILPLFFVLSLGAIAFGCKSKTDDTNGTSGQTGGTTTPGATNPAADPTIDPTQGIDPATAILETDAYTDGPIWHAGMGVLFFTTPLGEGALYRMLPDGRVLKVRDGVSASGTTPIGNTVTADGQLVTVDAKQIVRGPADGDPAVVATGYPDPFDTLKGVTARKDGTLYVTDPGYFANPIANHIFRVDLSGNVQVVDAFDDVPRPNGVALSPDQKLLYVGFTKPTAGTLPFIRSYTVNDDGTLGAWTKLLDIGPDDTSQPDGLTVDAAGNIYAATATGVQVFKATGEAWGTIAVPEQPTGVTFGGADLHTLYITTQGMKIWQVQMKVVGVSQTP